MKQISENTRFYCYWTVPLHKYWPIIKYELKVTVNTDQSSMTKIWTKSNRWFTPPGEQWGLTPAAARTGYRAMVVSLDAMDAAAMVSWTTFLKEQCEVHGGSNASTIDRGRAIPTKCSLPCAPCAIRLVDNWLCLCALVYLCGIFVHVCVHVCLFLLFAIKGWI